ncbi:unnamed protein product [Diabrotica balteata]|uniref:Short-chain dehydrogenase n=1 Tax=Diabrotica balteata TaxID=107213 RepID=A0A9N9STS5_DIABA|nr:unnamed protein product [Diabrotica balteata]
MIVYNYTIYIKYIAFAVIAISLPFIALIVLKFFQKFSAGKVRSLVCLSGKTAIVTGASSGIGYETALQLASRGCRVILADRKEAAKAKAKIIAITNNSKHRNENPRFNFIAVSEEVCQGNKLDRGEIGHFDK